MWHISLYFLILNFPSISRINPVTLVLHYSFKNLLKWIREFSFCCFILMVASIFNCDTVLYTPLTNFTARIAATFSEKEICESTLGEPLQSNRIIVSPRNYSEYEVKGGYLFLIPAWYNLLSHQFILRKAGWCVTCAYNPLFLWSLTCCTYLHESTIRAIPQVSMDPVILRIQFKRQMWNTTQQWKGTN